MEQSLHRVTPQSRSGRRHLEKLVGTWKVGGEAIGEVTYEWMEGGFFLIQRGVFEREGARHVYFGFVGYDGDAQSADGTAVLTSRLYTTTGDILDYVSEAGERELTVWHGAKGSPSFYRGTWSADGRTLSGEWEWPGGGYRETMTRID